MNLKILIIKCLPGCTALTAFLAVVTLAIGLWRLGSKNSQRAWFGPRMILLSLGLILVSGVGYSQYIASQKGRLDYCRTTLGMSFGTALEMYAQDHEGEL